MKVSLITLHAIDNYGSVFQALATEKLFLRLGCEIETVDYVRENASADTVWKILKVKGASSFLKAKMILRLLLPNRSNRKEVLDAFRKKFLHLSQDKYRSDDDLLHNPPVADLYCTGSDQTWNTVCQGEIPLPYFLSFAPDDKPKIAFSASFGINTLPEKDKLEVKHLLQRYKAISVREISGVSILSDLGLKGELVLDPTLAIGPEFWNNLAAPRMIDEDYLLAYQLNRSKQFTKYMKEYARRNHLKIIQIRSVKDTIIHNGVCYTDVSPEELLSLFKYSKKVLTDSFHATAFSLLFHCDFLVIYPVLFSSRLDSILELTSLHCRHVTDVSRFDYDKNAIDYETVDSILLSERKKTVSFLERAIV